VYRAVGPAVGASLGEWTAQKETCSDVEYAEACIGWEWSCPDRDFCCGTNELYNAEYARIKGPSTARWVNERRVIFYVFQALLNPADGFDTGLDAYAWNAGTPGTTVWLDPAFVERVRRAMNNFNSLLPVYRWKLNPVGGLKCGVPVQTYTEGTVDKSTASYKRALNDVLTKGSYQDTWAKAENHINAVVNSVPGSHSWLFRDNHPDVALHLLTTVPVPPAKGGGMTVAARPWLDELLRVFAPPDPKGSSLRAMPALMALRKPARTVKPSAMLAQQAARIDKAFLSEDGGVSSGRSFWAIVGVGAAVVVGAGALYLTVSRK